MAEPEPYPIPDAGDQSPQSPDSDSSLPETDAAPQIPWERRKEIGDFRAYWRTAWMVMTRPGDLEQFLDGPVCEKRAKYFRSFTFQLTVFMTAGVLIALLGNAHSVAHGAGDTQQIYVPTIPQIATSHMWFRIASLVGLFLATRSLEWFSCPRAFDRVRQDRAVALSCYLCAPILVVTVVGGIASLAAILTWEGQDIRPVMYVVTLAWLAVFLAWYPAAVRAIYFTTGRSVRRTIVTAIGLPLIWAGQQFVVSYLLLSGVIWYNMAQSLL